MHTLTLSQLAGISPQELQRVDDMLEKLVRERNAEKIVEIVKEYVKRNVRVVIAQSTLPITITPAPPPGVSEAVSRILSLGFCLGTLSTSSSIVFWS